MFEQLSDRLGATFQRLRGRPQVTEADLAEALRDVRVALLEADVNSAAAIDELMTLGRQLGVHVRAVDPSRVAADVAALTARAGVEGSDTVIVDTAGRLHIDEAMMDEIAGLVTSAKPHEVLLVVDAMAGQDAVDSAVAFQARLPLTGLVLAKADGDARGGASLSVRAVTGIPVKLIGTGEKLDALEVFHPDRLAQRILGMGDIVTLVERAREQVDEKTAEEQARKLLEAQFTFDDFYAQLQQLKRMGPLGDLLKMIPGIGGAAEQRPGRPEGQRELRRVGASIFSMTA